MNIHHLELFYYVARFGGISSAARRMPYGIQQPAVSSQIRQLEQDLGVNLFRRQPFRLTEAGQELLAFVRPFFDNLDAFGLRLRQRAAPQLTIAAAEVVLRDHLPAVLQRLKQQHAGVRVALRSGFQAEIERWVTEREVDVAIMPRPEKLPARVYCTPLLRVPLVLLVPKTSSVRSAAELWTRGRVEEPLVSLPGGERITRIFQSGLQARGVTWPVAIEASSMMLITHYVANGSGFGVNLMVPDIVQHPQVRVLPLEGFEDLELVAAWRGEPKPLVRTLLAEIQRYAREAWPKVGGARRETRRARRQL